VNALKRGKTAHSVYSGRVEVRAYLVAVVDVKRWIPVE